MRNRSVRYAAVVMPFAVALGSLVACGSNAGSPTSSSAAATTGAAAGTGTGGASGSGTGGIDGAGGTAPVTPTRKTIKGEATWKVTFDADAKAKGATDCSYSRTYDGVEDRSAPWLCPSCEIMFLAQVEVTSGLADCFSQISTSTPAKEEWLGYGDGTWWRSPGGPLSDQGMTTLSASEIKTTNNVVDAEAPNGGTFAFDISGQYTLGEAEGDPMNGWVSPETFACGWPKTSAPAYTGGYTLQKDTIIPDGLLKDACDEVVRIHDFAGAYLVVEMSARDCPPCQTMASQEEKFIADMAAKGIPVAVVTLLAPALDDVYGLTTQTMLTNWTKKYKLTSPVLADRGFGLALFEPALGEETIGYPSWTVVRPDLTVVDFGTGFGGFNDMADLIEADMK